MRIGSLFSGVAGLDRAVEQFFGATVAWFVEFDAAPSKVLAHHYPDAPNYGNVTAVDWANVEPVDILTGGFPCQDVSLAGARRGLKDGTRSGLWSEYAKAIDILRPRLVVIENVRGLLSASTVEDINEADSDMEWEQGGVGEPVGGNRPILNAFGRVLGDLAELGYDAEWVGLRAADAGAPHGRFRVFIVARPANADDFILGTNRGEVARRAPSGKWAGKVHRLGSSHRDRGGAATPVPEHVIGYGTGRAWDGWAEPSDCGGATADTSRYEPERRRGGGDLGSPKATGEGNGEERKRVRDAACNSCPVAANPLRVGGHEGDNLAGLSGEEEIRAGVADERGTRSGGTQWGAYGPAIERWETVTGRPAPAPTNPDGKNGQHRLSAAFVEWLMGWPAGWATDPAIGLTRNEQLKACGNGVVTQQALLALTVLLGREQVAA